MEVLIKSDDIISKVDKEYSTFTQDEELSELYWMRVEGQKRIITEKEVAYQEGKAEGRQEGEKMGMEKGEKISKIETTKKLKQLGIDINKISQATGLSKEEIEKL